MKGSFTSGGWIALMLAATAAVFSLSSLTIRAADNDLPIYFPDSTLVLKTQTVNRIQYLPLADLVRHLNLAATNDTTQEIFTIRGNASIVLTRNSTAISVNNQITLLGNPVLHDNGVWLVPPDFLQQGLFRITGIDFRRKAGSPRIFAGAVKPADLALNAQAQGSNTRLTLRTSTPVTLELKRDNAQHRAMLVFAPKPIDPSRESMDYKDRLVGSINFNDSDGSPKLVVEISDDVGDIRMSSTDENRIHFIDFVRKTETTEAVPAPAPSPTPTPAPAAAANVPAARPNLPSNRGPGIRVIVIDPGHGGTDSGISTTGALEKDLTLAIARKLRPILQSRLGATVLLTRDSDVPLNSEARTAVANNNQADLFISLHIGFSANKDDLSSSVYVIQDNFASSLAPLEKGQRLFLPWYLGYRTNRQSSVQVAGLLSEDLGNSLPGWKFPVRSGPVGVLASTTMPSVLIELGNLNNPSSIQALLDGAFQTKFSVTVAAAIERFAAARQAEK
jgi:N-acetylmuramoyl-L-alanine amidase